jgi:hypothetical protein
MQGKNSKKNKGFVMLFAVTLAAILLSIALGVAEIAQKEIKFGTSAKNTNDAFFAADTGVECALYWDKIANNAFSWGNQNNVTKINCASFPDIINSFTESSGTLDSIYDFEIHGLGSAGKSCVRVNVLKEKPDASKIVTTITSKGYSTSDPNSIYCTSSSGEDVSERVLQVKYGAAISSEAPTTTLTANPSTIISGNSTSLHWESTGATQCTSDDFTTNNLTTGDVTVSPTTDTTYLIACTGDGGSVPDDATVTVTSPAPGVTLTATPGTVPYNGSSTLTWSSTNADTCSSTDFATGGATSNSVGVSTGALTTNTTYTISCLGPGGSISDFKTVTVNAPAVPTVTLSANPASGTSPVTSTLTWTVSGGATSCTATDGTSAWNTPSSKAFTDGQHTQQITGLTSTTTFSISCANAGGTSSVANAIVTVNAIPTCNTSFPSNQFNVCYFAGQSAPTDSTTPILSTSTETLSATFPVGTLNPAFDHNWGSGQVGNSGRTNDVSGVWRGSINFQAGSYIFHTYTDDGVELKVGNNIVINNWTDHGPTTDNSNNINLPAGPLNVQMRWYENGGGADAKLWWDKILGGTVAYPNGNAWSIPGTIQAENFDTAGAGISYEDTTPGNEGGEYRTTDVDIQTTTDTGGGYNVGWMSPGENLEYSVNVTSSGAYNVNLRVASAQQGGVLHLESSTNGDWGWTDLTGPIIIPNTGWWQTWETVTIPNVNLTAGQKFFRLVVDSGTEGGSGNINYISFEPYKPMPSYKMPSAKAGTTTGSLTISKPTNATQGDLLIAAIAYRPNTATATPPQGQGWTLIRRLSNSNSNANNLEVYRKFVGANEPANYTWQMTGAAGSNGGIMAFAGASSSNPINVENGRSYPATSEHLTPTVTATASNTMLVAVYGYSSARSWTAPTGMFEGVNQYGDGGNESLGMFYQGKVSPGSVGEKRAYSGDSDAGNAMIIVIQP